MQQTLPTCLPICDVHNLVSKTIKVTEPVCIIVDDILGFTVYVDISLIVTQ